MSLVPAVFCLLTFVSSIAKDVLYDSPVSNHGARVRLLSRFKKIELDIRSPSLIGGVKSSEFASYSYQAKTPVLVCEDGFVVIESDCICRYLISKHASIGPSFLSPNLRVQSLSDQICRVHDVYISPIQSCMYRAPGNVFGVFGTDRAAALAELRRQLLGLDNMLSRLDPAKDGQEFLCGGKITLSDVALYPTLVFCQFMLPQFFGLREEQYLGPRVAAWRRRFSQLPEVGEVEAEITGALEGWRSAGRWDPILKEMQQVLKP